VVWPQNHWDRFGDLDIKITVMVSQFEPQNWWLRFGDLDQKITMTIS
jgi:hypothetical protein